MTAKTAKTKFTRLHNGVLGIRGPESEVVEDAVLAITCRDGSTAVVTVDRVIRRGGGEAEATYTAFNEADLQILQYVEENPGCTEREAITQGGHRPIDRYYENAIRALTWRGLLLDEGMPGRSSLYLTEEGQAVAHALARA